MTKTIEEVKTAKQELERKISQMVNEFANEHKCLLTVSIRSYDSCTVDWKFKRVYVCDAEIKL